MKMDKINFKSIVMNAPFGYASHKIIGDQHDNCFDAEIIDINPAFECIAGLKTEEILGKSLRQVMPEIFGDDFNWAKHFGNIALNGGNIEFEQFVKPLERWYKVHVYSDEKNYFSTVFIDITKQFHSILERKQAEDKLRQSEEKYRAISEDMPLMICTFLSDYTLSYVNRAYCDYFNKSERELLGKPFLDLIPESDQSGVISRMESLSIESPVMTYERKVINSNKLYSWYRWTNRALFDEHRKLIGYQSIGEDITEQKRAEEELMLKAEILDQIGDYVSVTDLNGIILYANKAECNSIGLSKEQIIGQSIEIFGEDAKQASTQKEILQKTLQEGTWRGEVLNYDKEGKLGKTLECRTWLLMDSNNSPKGIIGVSSDITRQKQIEEELVKAKEKAEESNCLKSAFLANMSHEIRTPMNGILGFANLLKEPDLSGVEQKNYIELINQSGERMLNIINDIVDISKIESGLMELSLSTSNINEQIQYIHNFFKAEAEAKGIRIVANLSLEDSEATLITDREKVYAILTNLVKNAIKYTTKGEIELGCIRKGNFLEFYVKDTGIGIPKARYQAIFERFVQADIENRMAYQGAGLGLAISKAYVEMLGGEIWVESEQEKGSIFYFTIPCYNKPEVKQSEHQHVFAEKIKESRKLNILIVEDDEISELLLEKIVGLISNEVLKARTGVEAVELAKSNPDIDLILMDVCMPELGGYEATKKIRQFNKEVVIIAQTANVAAESKEFAIESGCNDYIAKPIDRDKLYELICKFFI